MLRVIPKWLLIILTLRGPKAGRAQQSQAGPWLLGSTLGFSFLQPELGWFFIFLWDTASSWWIPGILEDKANRANTFTPVTSHRPEGVKY
jgi:hypothetical protein